jgi:2'-5' RNA ligase
MNSPRAGFVVPLALLLAASAAAAGVSCPPSVVDDKGLGKVPLFSALSLSKTPFAKKWAKAQKELAKEFPDLRFEKPSNLHVTLAFMSVSGWDPAKLEDMEKLGLDGPDLSSGPVKLVGTPDLFGTKKEVVALRLDPVPAEWSKRLMADRQAMTDKGLRPRDRFDEVFTPHVSLATAPKPDEQRDELARFQMWLVARAKDFGELKIELDKTIAPRYFLVIGKDAETRFEPVRGYCSDAKK